ncbi:Sm-like protein lsm7 [Bonamia ostreae]|uniref:Sm-like protein lsm7 n=1 Tax=Bonamia ostreae TaxID=126728 RepID=A0ABV2AQV3_9EUKA
MNHSNKRSVFDLNDLINEKITVEFVGGRTLSGVLKGYDPLLNLVIDQGEENLQKDCEDSSKDVAKTRKLGLAVCKGNCVMTVYPQNGSKIIENPFTGNDDGA